MVESLLVRVHAAASYENNTSADYEDSTNDVEDGGTDATGIISIFTNCIELQIHHYEATSFQTCSIRG